MNDEIRMHKSERNPNAQIRILTPADTHQNSGFVILSSFVIISMSDILFYIFAALTLICGFLVIANPFSRNPVTSAMFLVLAIGSMAGLFVLLHAFFLAAVQVLVYAGAVMVLFLFVIMLLDLKAEERRKVNLMGAIAGVVSV